MSDLTVTFSELNENAEKFCGKFYDSYHKQGSSNGDFSVSYLTRGAEAALYKCEINDPVQFNDVPDPTSK